MTEKQRWARIRARHKMALRRYLALRGGSGAIEEYLSMNAFELREYIENQWLTGMNWGNYGTFWVVDHIVGLKYFDPTNIEEMKLCWHHINMQPAYLMDNHAKGYCVEITMRVLDAFPNSAIKTMLLQKVEDRENMFEVYYNKAV